MKTLKSQFLFDLEKIHDVEHRIAKALPRMVKADMSEELKQAILSHAQETERHVTKVEQVLECFPQPANGAAPAEDATTDPRSNDEQLTAALKMVGQNGMAHDACRYEGEIASYRCLNQWAKLMGNSEGADLLEQILEEEEATRQRDQAPSVADQRAM